MIYILTALFAILGFVLFLFVSVFVGGEFWGEQRYETALPYVLGIAILGAVLGGSLARRIFRKRSQK